jgi:hypothetical protein
MSISDVNLEFNKSCFTTSFGSTRCKDLLYNWRLLCHENEQNYVRIYSGNDLNDCAYLPKNYFEIKELY